MIKSILNPILNSTIDQSAKIWYNQALYYFHFNRNLGYFGKEFNFIRLTIGKLKPYIPITKIQ